MVPWLLAGSLDRLMNQSKQIIPNLCTCLCTCASPSDPGCTYSISSDLKLVPLLWCRPPTPVIGPSVLLDLRRSYLYRRGGGGVIKNKSLSRGTTLEQRFAKPSRWQVHWKKVQKQRCEQNKRHLGCTHTWSWKRSVNSLHTAVRGTSWCWRKKGQIVVTGFLWWLSHRFMFCYHDLCFCFFSTFHFKYPHSAVFLFGQNPPTQPPHGALTMHPPPSPHIHTNTQRIPAETPSVPEHTLLFLSLHHPQFPFNRQQRKYNPSLVGLVPTGLCVAKTTKKVMDFNHIYWKWYVKFGSCLASCPSPFFHVVVTVTIWIIQHTRFTVLSIKNPHKCCCYDQKKITLKLNHFHG